jgi:hypothetical protein
MRSYRERLFVPVTWWLLGLICVVLIGSFIWAGLSWYWPQITYAVLGIVVAAFLLNWNSAVIEVEDGVLRAGGASLPLDQVDEAVALDEQQAAVLRGPRADPAAHLLLRPYAKRAVFVRIADPAGSVPYWLVSTRKPEELAAAIQRSRETVG